MIRSIAMGSVLWLALAGNIEALGQDNPGPRWGHALVWDDVRQEVLLFGGSRERGKYLGDTWTWNGKRWRRHEVESPAPRGFAAAVFHAERGTIVLHGGRAEGRRPHKDAWEWNGREWSPLEGEVPFGADHHAMVYLPESEELLVFGGWDGSGVSGETWLFDGGWRRHEGQGPPARSAFGMVFDEKRGVAVLCGGLWIDGQYADVWEWSQERWRAVCGPYDNSSLDHHALAWDPRRQQVVGYGGKNYRYRELDRTFSIRDGRSRALAQQGPGARHSTPLAWDGQCVLLYGGKRYEGDTMQALEDLWRWDGRRWERISAQ